MKRLGAVLIAGLVMQLVPAGLAAQKSGRMEDDALLKAWLERKCAPGMREAWEAMNRAGAIFSSGLDTIPCSNCDHGEGLGGMPPLPGMTVSTALLDSFELDWEAGIRGLATFRACYFQTRPAVGIGDDNARLRYRVDNDLKVHVVPR